MIRFRSSITRAALCLCLSTTTIAGSSATTSWTAEDLRPALEGIDRQPTLSTEELRLGADIYRRAHCDRCHGPSPTSPDTPLGPTLDGLLFRYSAVELLDHILEPNRFVDGRYKTVVVELNNGTLREGYLVGETAQHIELLPNAMEPVLRHRIEKKTVKRRDVLDLSPMPDGLVEARTAQEVIALIAFLLHPPPQG